MSGTFCLVIVLLFWNVSKTFNIYFCTALERILVFSLFDFHIINGYKHVSKCFKEVTYLFVFISVIDCWDWKQLDQ